MYTNYYVFSRRQELSIDILHSLIEYILHVLMVVKVKNSRIFMQGRKWLIFQQLGHVAPNQVQ